MAQVVYDGEQPARVVVLPSGKQIRAEKGKPVNVPDAVAERLCEQRDWAPAKQASSTPTKAPAKAGAKEE